MYPFNNLSLVVGLPALNINVKLNGALFGQTEVEADGTPIKSHLSEREAAPMIERAALLTADWEHIVVGDTRIGRKL